MTNTEIIDLMDRILATLNEVKKVLEAYNNHVAELHQEIQYRDNRITELEGELIIKNSIINKQAVILTGEGK